MSRFAGSFFDLPASKCHGATPLFSRVDFPVKAGERYRVQVGGQNNPNIVGGIPSTGDYVLDFLYYADTDGDGVFDGEDRCDGQVGPAGLQGCPDSDGDGIANPDDRCVGRRGPVNFRGCADSDTDGRPDIDDRCPGYDASDRDPNRDGCLDLHLLVDSKIVPAGVYRGGRMIRSLRILKVPKGSRVSISCRRSRGRRNCGNTLIRKATAASVKARFARTVRIRRVQGKRLPFGSKITIRVTKAGETGWYRSYTVVRSAKKFKLTNGCTNVGSRKVRQAGLQLRTPLAWQQRPRDSVVLRSAQGERGRNSPCDARDDRRRREALVGCQLAGF